MNDMVRTILIMSATGSILALLLLVFKPIARHRLPKSIQYYLWLVVIAAFLIPVSRLVVLPGIGAAPIPAMPTITETVTRFVITQAEEAERLERLAPLAATNHPVYLQERQAVQSPIAFITTYFVLIYPFGVLILLLYYVIHYAIFVGLYRRRNRLAGPKTRAMLADMCSGSPPRIYFNPLTKTPMLFGIFRPAIILPCREYTREEMQAILSHELTHLRRKDILIKWLMLITTALHWYNPVVWLVSREIDRACELSCDEAVIQDMDGQGRQHYGNTLIMVAASPKTPRVITSATMSEDKKNLKERLGAIMKNRRHSRPVFMLSVLLIAAAIGLAACLGSGNGNNPIVIETESPADSPTYNEDSAPDYPIQEDAPAIELILRMIPAADASLGSVDLYHEIDFREVYITQWGVDVDWLTTNSPAVIWANIPLNNFQIIGLYNDFVDDGIIASATHVYYEMAVLDAPLVINWFFTAGLFPNNGISFIDADGIRRYFAIQAAYGYEGAEPFTLIEFGEDGYIFRWPAPEDAAADDDTETPETAENTNEDHTQGTETSAANPFAAALLEYFEGGVEASEYMMRDSTKAFMVDVTGNGRPGVVAVRHFAEHFAQARIFYLVDGQLTYKDIPHIEGFPYSLAVNLEGRLVMPAGDGGHNTWSLFELVGTAGVGASGVFWLEPGFTVYRAMVDDGSLSYYFSIGGREHGFQGGFEPITEEEFNVIFQRYGLDNLTLWFDMVDETEQILAQGGF